MRSPPANVTRMVSYWQPRSTKERCISASSSMKSLLNPTAGPKLLADQITFSEGASSITADRSGVHGHDAASDPVRVQLRRDSPGNAASPVRLQDGVARNTEKERAFRVLQVTLTFPLGRLSRGHCILRVHSACSPSSRRTGGLPDGNPATPNYRQIFLTLYNAHHNAWCVRFCVSCTPLVVVRDAGLDPGQVRWQGRPSPPIPMRPKGAVWVVPRAPGMVRRAGGSVSLKPLRIGRLDGRPTHPPGSTPTGAPSGSSDVRPSRSIRFVCNLVTTANRR